MRVCALPPAAMQHAAFLVHAASRPSCLETEVRERGPLGAVECRIDPSHRYRPRGAAEGLSRQYGRRVVSTAELRVDGRIPYSCKTHPHIHALTVTHATLEPANVPRDTPRHGGAAPHSGSAARVGVTRSSIITLTLSHESVSKHAQQILLVVVAAGHRRRVLLHGARGYPSLPRRRALRIDHDRCGGGARERLPAGIARHRLRI